ncbi:HAD-IA family hydrolase [Pleomorphomonas sp. JP5]|uniref:HAD-IA family hydrolase n=1 Tax=Pleomorphomonas sp. JP5 TaxID=2942998 RepID=UPI0020433563|nr:HAD-IA family hydrolase [Pleomorphomonas sp. JP5]MCM5560353.1 HAD-IA family hydrolase [Pleomorphomonas sp. JP5]
MTPKLVLFDCDGTLVDSQQMIVATMTEAFTKLGHAPPDRAGVLSIIGLSLPEAVGRLDPSLDVARVALVAEAYRDTYQAMQFRLAETAPLYPGALDALRTLSGREDVLLGIVTGKSRRGLDAILETHGLTNLFSVLRTADDGPSKPHPFMVVDAMSALGGDASQTVVVGDTGYDMLMARAAGAFALGVTWGYNIRDELSQAGAQELADDFAEVPSLAMGLLGAKE